MNFLFILFIIYLFIYLFIYYSYYEYYLYFYLFIYLPQFSLNFNKQVPVYISTIVIKPNDKASCIEENPIISRSFILYSKQL